MGNYISPEMTQNRQITPSIKNTINDLNKSLNQPAQNIWNSGQYGSSLDSGYINNMNNNLIASLNQPMTAIPNSAPYVPAVDPMTSAYSNMSKDLIASLNQPMANPGMPTPNMLNTGSNPMMAQVNTLGSQTQALISGNNNFGTSIPGLNQVDPITGQTNNTQTLAAQDLNNKYINVAAIVNDPRQQMKLAMLSDQIKGGLKDGWFDDRDEIKQIVGQLKPEELAGLEIVYGTKNGNPTQLREDLRKHFAYLSPGKETPEEVKMLNKAALASPTNAMLALKDSMNGSFVNIDKETLNQIISKSEPVFLSQVAMEYQQQTGKSLVTDLKDKLWWSGGDSNNLVPKLTNALINDKTKSGY